jgi:hypothetical protein
MSIRRLSERLAAVLLVFVFAFAFAFAGSAAADEDTLAPYRDRFRQGMEKYQAGSIAEAIGIWRAIYDEIGAERGYRLSFDLARAYEANFETSRAAERYQSFLEWVAKREAGGEVLDPIVLREKDEAEARLQDLNATSGRIHILVGGSSGFTQIDSADPRLGSFVAYVAPGTHIVVFGPHSDAEERRDVKVNAGEIIDVAPAPHVDIPFPALSERVPVAQRPVTVVRRLEVAHPFSPVVLYVGLGATAASVIVPALTYAHAYSLINTHNSTGTGLPERLVIESEYPAARTEAYASLALPITLGVVTTALIGYYFGGAKEHEVRLAASPVPGGGAAAVEGVF